MGLSTEDITTMLQNIFYHYSNLGPSVESSYLTFKNLERLLRDAHALDKEITVRKL